MQKRQQRMWFKSIFLFLVVSLLAGDLATAQVSTKTDSTQVYKDIQTYSKRGPFRKFMYRILFKPVASSPLKRNRKKDRGKEEKRSYGSFDGKIIRKINIITLDPFGYSISDTSAKPQNFVYKAGNSAHIKTREITIQNLLLFGKNDKFNSLLVNESERLIRSQSYIHDVSITAEMDRSSSDSVDIYIRVSDIWSITPDGSISTSSAKGVLTDQNFLGTGHEFQNACARNYADGSSFFSTKYYVPNIKNTFINSTLHYEIDGSKSYTKMFSIDRPFFSPVAKWAAGASFSQQYSNDSIYTSNSLSVLQTLKYNTQDYWVGNAIRLFKGNTDFYHVSNFITTIRFLRIRYITKPDETVDLDHSYFNENMYLASIGLSTRKYIKDKYIFKQGVTEDVPIGSVYSITTGYQIKNSIERLYFGFRISMGNLYSFGYLSSNFEYGTFYRASAVEQGVISAGIIYFSPLVEFGRWKFRQFVKPQVTIGIQRFASDSLTLKNGYGLDSFNSSDLSGTSKLLFTIQTQSYAPWNFYGFRFGPYLTYSIGMLSDAVSGFRKRKVYSQLGFGILIKNENLIFSTFQISISYYPIIPGIGPDVFKQNVYRTTDFNFSDFDIGKPETVAYQ